MPNLQVAENLSLYHYQACPFCAVTRNVLNHIDLNVEQRDILKNPQHRQDLISGGGMPQVPCLRIEENGKIKWLYESSDIISFLKQKVKKK
ncbi:MAG: glutaredoxin [Oleiphilaceae bacterium]|jgi:glutaredoxin